MAGFQRNMSQHEGLLQNFIQRSGNGEYVLNVEFPVFYRWFYFISVRLPVEFFTDAFCFDFP